MQPYDQFDHWDLETPIFGTNQTELRVGTVNRLTRDLSGYSRFIV